MNNEKVGNRNFEQAQEEPAIERQKRKTVAYFLSGEKAEWINSPDAEGIGEEDVSEYLDKVEGGEIGYAEKERFLQRIQGPVERRGEDGVFFGDPERGAPGIAGLRQEQRILATMTGVGFNNYAQTGAEEVAKFVEKYPTPLDFEASAGNFLEVIQKENSAEKYQQYVRSMESFQRKIYGKKYEYYLALKELDGALEERKAEKARAERMDDTVILGRERLRMDGRKIGRRMERLLKREAEGEELSPEEGREMLKKAELDGDALIDPDTGERREFSREDLMRAELAPNYEMKLDGVRFGFSEVFNVGGKDAVISYVEKDGKTFARSYYRSGSQGVWRYLPDRTQDPETKRFIWYGKGMSEEAITLPSEVQATLNKRAEASEALKMSEDEMSERQKIVAKERVKAFYGTARETMLRVGRFVGDGKNDALAREMSFKARYEFPNDVPPERLRLRDELMPDFGKEVLSYQGSSRIYGEFKATVFKSGNGDLKWTMMEDREGRAWVGQVETQAPITSTGCRKDWVSAGDFATPAYEYLKQDRGYGDMGDVKLNSRGGVQYVSMWKNYLQRVPMIREYKARQGEKVA